MDLNDFYDPTNKYIIYLRNMYITYITFIYVFITYMVRILHNVSTNTTLFEIFYCI